MFAAHGPHHIAFHVGSCLPKCAKIRFYPSGGELQPPYWHFGGTDHQRHIACFTCTDEPRRPEVSSLPRRNRSHIFSAFSSYKASLLIASSHMLRCGSFFVSCLHTTRDLSHVVAPPHRIKSHSRLFQHAYTCIIRHYMYMTTTTRLLGIVLIPKKQPLR